MSNRNPRRVLPPESQAWGRELERKVKALETELEILRKNLLNTQKGLNNWATVIGGHSHDRIENVLETEDGVEEVALRIGVDGAPRLFSEPSLVFERKYTANRPDGSTNRLMAVTPLGSIGALADVIDRNYLAIASGNVPIVVPSGQVEASVIVTFPANRFTVRPIVALATHSVAETLINYSVTAVTTTSCRINVRRTSTAETLVDWVAVQE